MVLLGKVDDDNYPFLGFDQNGEPNVQVPTLSVSKEIEIMSSIKSHSSPCLSKMAVPVPAETVKRKKKQMIGPASRMKMKNIVRQNASEEACIPDRSQISLQMLPQPSDHMPEDIFDDPELHVSSVKSEVDDNDMTIDNDVFDCSSYNLTESPTSESSLGPPSSQTNSGMDFLSENVSDCKLPSDGNANGFKNGMELKDLTTQLLELNNKNIDLDKKLAKLKKEYEAKVFKIHAEKKGNELQIKNILQVLQDWRDSSDSSCLGLSQISSDKNSTGISSVVEEYQQATERGASTKKSIKKSVSKNRSKNIVCVERSQISCCNPEPSFIESDTHPGDILDFEGAVSLESIDAELVCLSDMYGPKKSRVCVSKIAQEKPIKEASEINRGATNCPEKYTEADIIKKMSSLKPVVCLNDIYANKREKVKKRVSINDVKCGSYVVIKLSSKKTFEHYCAVVRSKSEKGECFAQYMERKNDNEFIFPEKEFFYKIEEGDIVKVLQEPSVKVKGSRVYYTFPDSLGDIEALK